MLPLQDLRSEIDKKYVGFNPNTNSIKPVHIANGLFLSIYGKSVNTDLIHKLSYVRNAKGEAKYQFEDVYEWLKKSEKVDGVSKEALKDFRLVLQKLLSMDKAVFPSVSHTDYTAGSKMFITSLDSQFERAGALFGKIIKENCKEMHEYIFSLLDSTEDSISLLFSPIKPKEEDYRIFDYVQIENVKVFQENTDEIQNYIKDIQDCCSNLLSHFKKETNKLNILRQFVLFGIYSILKYILMLEVFYGQGKQRAILADFSNKNNSGINEASKVSFTQIHRSISSFYTWAFKQELLLFDIKELLSMEVPKYKKGDIDSGEKFKERKSIWDLAKSEIQDKNDKEEVCEKLAMAIYDLLEQDASSSPIVWYRNLAVNSGMLYPPGNRQPNKRFHFSTDILEMLLKCVVKPGEAIDGIEIRNRFWRLLGIIVGGREIDREILKESGFYLQIDEGTLSANFEDMSNEMINMNFAEQLADGILVIRLGGEI